MKNILPIILVLCVLFAHSQEEWNLNTPGQITYTNGKVGIGTNSPSHTLHVNGSGVFKDGSIIDIALTNPAGKNGIAFSPNEYGNYSRFNMINYDHPTPQNRYFIFRYNQDSQGLTIANGGNVGIGTTYTSNGKLTVNSSSSFNLLRLENEGLGNESAMRFRAKSSTGQLLHADISLYATGTNQGYLGFKVPHNNAPNTGYDLIINESGNVGLGTNIPFYSTNNKGIHLNRGIHSSMILGDPVSSGYGGIVQTSDSRHRIFIGANYYDDDTGSWQNFENGKGAAGISMYADEGSWGTSIDFLTSQGNGTIEKRLSVRGNGNVGIGTTNPTEKLEVAGTIYSQEVRVEVAAGTGPDYVFEPTYNLKSLEEIEQYIQSNKHLPEIPSAKEMEANGVQLGEMNMLLLKKIEELTLHLIEKEEQINNLTLRLEKLEKQ